MTASDPSTPLGASDSSRFSDHPIYAAAERGQTRQVRRYLADEPALMKRQDRFGATPLHRAVLGRSRNAVTLLLDLGADIHVQYGTNPKIPCGWPPQYSEPIDLALWSGARVTHDPHMAERVEVRTLVPDETVPQTRPITLIP